MATITYHEFCERDNKFRKLSNALIEWDDASVSHGDMSGESLSSMKESIATLREQEIPVYIHEGEGDTYLIQVCCDGLDLGNLPQPDEFPIEASEGKGQKIVVCAYAPEKDSPILSLRVGFSEPASSASHTADHSTFFSPRPPWDGNDISLLYECLAYAEQLAVMGCGGFVAAHVGLTIQDRIDTGKVGKDSKACDSLHGFQEEMYEKLTKADNENISNIYNELHAEYLKIIAQEPDLDEYKGELTAHGILGSVLYSPDMYSYIKEPNGLWHNVCQMLRLSWSQQSQHSPSWSLPEHSSLPRKQAHRVA